MGCEFHHPKIQWQPVLSCYRNQSGGLPSSLPSLLMPQLPGCSFVRRCHQPFGLATVDATRRAGHPSPRTCSARPRVKGVESSLMMSRNHHIADLTNHRPAAARSVRRDRTETSLLQRLVVAPEPHTPPSARSPAAPAHRISTETIFCHAHTTHAPISDVVNAIALKRFRA